MFLIRNLLNSYLIFTNVRFMKLVFLSQNPHEPQDGGSLTKNLNRYAAMDLNGIWSQVLSAELLNHIVALLPRMKGDAISFRVKENGHMTNVV